MPLQRFRPPAGARGREDPARTGMGRCSVHTCVFPRLHRRWVRQPAAPPWRVRAATATHACRSELTVTPAAPSRVERGALGGSDGPWCAGARHPGRLCSSVALPEHPGQRYRNGSAGVGERQTGSGGQQRDALPPPSARLPVSDHGKAEGTGRRTSWGGEGRRPLVWSHVNWDGLRSVPASPACSCIAA